MVLEHFGFPPNIVNLIMRCVTSTSTAILFNGNKLDSFRPSRGIRQGDPISPYLFLLCMEFLGAQISAMCEEKRWDKIKASKNGPSFSHIFYADDLMLFAKANSKNCNAILEVLENFCNMAAQRINVNKSRIFFSPNVSGRKKNSICRKLGLMATQNLGRYLGFPLLHQGRNGNAFNFVIERIQNKLAGWRSKLLSKAGKLILVKAAASPIADYSMQCHALPIKVCNAVDKLIRNFLWGSSGEKRKIHLVNWHTITLPKDWGGLGLYQMRYRKQALLAKLCWRIANENESPWAQLLTKKYLTPSRLSEEGRNRPCSKIWAACKMGGPVYVRGLKWIMANGESVKFW